LLQEAGSTSNYIVDGFWMQGEFVVFLSTDEANYIYIETYCFDSECIEPICEKVFLCDKSGFEKMDTKLSANREMVSVLIYNSVSINKALNVRSLNKAALNLSLKDSSWTSVSSPSEGGKKIY